MIRPVSFTDALGLTKLLHSLEDIHQIAAETFEQTLARVKRQFEQLVDKPAISSLLSKEQELDAFIHTIWHSSLIHQGGEGYIAELFVSLQKRSKGLGSLLLESIISEAKVRQRSRLSLLNMRHKTSCIRESGSGSRLNDDVRPEYNLPLWQKPISDTLKSGIIRDDTTIGNSMLNEVGRNAPMPQISSMTYKSR